MTDKEKRKVKDGVISIFNRFNILDHAATIGGLRDDILRYIDSLQEEPVSKDYRERYKRIAESEQFKKTHEGMSIGDIVPVEGEEPVSEDLEDEIQRYYVDWDEHPLYVQTARHFAKWQKEKYKSTTEDLGEYINELSKQFPEVSFAKLSRIAVRVAKWQKQQMMAKAIDGVVTFDYYDSGDKTYGCVAHDSFCLENFGLKDRDKVKVIVIKED